MGHLYEIQSENTALKEHHSDLPLVGIVIVNFNSYDLTLDCLNSLSKLSYPRHFIIIIDNNSPDGSGYRLKEGFEQGNVTVILNPENKGFAAANNIAMRHAQVYGADYIWLLNADTIVHPESLYALVQQAEKNPNVGAVGSKVLYAKPPPALSNSRNGEDVDIVWSAGARIDFKNQRVSMNGWHDADTGQFDETFECDYIPGCSLLVKSSVLDDIGFMPEEYFMYYEETEWCVRMGRAGYKLYCEPRSVVWHRFDDDKLNTPFGVYYFNRNDRLFWFRQGNFFNKLKIFLRTALVDLPKVYFIIRNTKDEDQRKIFFAHSKSYKDFILRRFGHRQLG
jgi:GT2 family glycosyltransferase